MLRKEFDRFRNSLLHPGLRVAVMSGLLGLAFCLPWVLYGVFGPQEGNPLAFQILAGMGLPGAGIGFIAGLSWWLAARSKRAPHKPD